MSGLNIDIYYDIGCDVCGCHRSTDFQFGLETDKNRLKKYAISEGWKFETATKKNVCPRCVDVLKITTNNNTIKAAFH